MSDALLQRLQAEREVWVELGGGQAVKATLPGFVQRARLAGLDNAQRLWQLGVEQVVDWRGFTAPGGADALAFSAPLWRLLADDHEDWVVTVASAVMDARQQRQAAAEAAAKN